MRRNLTLLGVLLTMACWGDSLTIAPGNGTSTNVSVRLTGELDVIANPGSSGGGIVTLGRYNDYTGSTSNGCGTLVATSLAHVGARSSIGMTGPLVLGAGTFRYAGPAGETLSHSVTNTFSGSQTNSAVVIDAASDFGFDGQWVQSTGALIKRGAGTFTIHGAPNGATNYFGVTENVKTSDRILGLSAMSTPTIPANGDSPTSGYAGLTIGEGTLKIDGGVNLFGQRWGTRIGMKTAIVEATPTLELAGGTNIFYGAFYVGTTLSGGEAVVRVTGGENTLAYSNSSDNKVLRLGGNAGSFGKLEMTGGKLTVANSKLNFSLSATNNFTSSITISGGTLVVNRYLLLGWEAKSGNTMSSDLTVSGTGFLDVSASSDESGIEIYNNKNAYMTFNVVVRDGGTVRTTRFFRSNATNTRAVGNLLVDGGIIWGSASKPIFGDGAADKGFSREGVRIGTKGMILQTGDTLTLSVPMLATNTVENMEPAGLTLRPSDSGYAKFLFTTNNSYAGPTRVQKKAQLSLSTGDLPEASEVTCEAGGFIYLGNHARTFKSLNTIGSTYYVLMTNAAVTVTDSFTATAGVRIYLKDDSDADWQVNLATPGVYTVLTVPLKDVDALRQFAAGSYTVGSGVHCRHWIETTATTATLKVHVFGGEGDRTITLGDGDVYDLGFQTFDLCATEGNGYTLTLLTNSVLRAANLRPWVVNDDSIRVFFNGGTFAPVFGDDENSYLEKVNEWIVGAGGAIFDLTNACSDPANATDFLSLRSVFRHDPDLGDAPDGGLLVKAGPVILGAEFVCAFMGPIRVVDRGRLTAGYSADRGCTSMANASVEIAPSAVLEQYNSNTVCMANLTLGEAEATTPTFLTVVDSSTRPGFAVTNALSVLSSVQISSRANTFPSMTRTTPSGTRTILVFNSSRTTIDAASFSINDADHPDVEATFSIVDYSNADLPSCDKALVMICTAKANPYPIWTAVAGGGDWNSLANWTNTETIPNGTAAGAVFNPATAANVPVALPADGVTLKTLTLDGASGQGYALSGGTLTLEPYHLSTATLRAASGAHRVANLRVDDSAQLQTATNATTGISSLEATALTGSGTVSVNPSTGAGTVKLGTAGFTGSISTGSGVTEVDDLAFATTASRLKTGSSTFRYTGPNATISGFQLNGGRATYFETDADLFARTPVATKGALTKAGSGTLTLGGTGVFAPTASAGYSGGDYVMHANGDTPANGYYAINVNEGTLAIGVTGNDDHAPTVVPLSSSNRQLAIGTAQMPAGTQSACLQMNNGLLTGYNLTLSFHLEASPVTGYPILRYEQNGGTTTVTNYLRTGYTIGKKKPRFEVEINGGELNVGTYVYLNFDGPNADNTVTNVFTVNGGVVNAVGFYGSYGDDVPSTKKAPTFVALNGGRLSVTGNFDFLRVPGSTTVLDLNKGGTLEAGRVIQTATTGGTFNFNGGTFIPLGRSDGTTLSGISAVNVSTNGAVVDTSRVLGGTYTIGQTLAHDARLGDAVDGGLVKKGTGTLVLAATNTYTGTTTVDAGTLALASDGAIPAAVAVAYDGMLDLGNATRAVPTLVRAPGIITNGTLEPGGFAVTGDLENDADCPFINGDLVVDATATLDLGIAYTTPSPSFTTDIPLAYVTGTTTIPKSIKAVHAGDRVNRFALRIESGLLVARPTSGAMVIIIR